jgi:peptidoglycan DL-endopeptidase CwlO
MGIYLGGDQFVHAPHTGDVVKVSSLSGYSGYVGAVRP